jgi:hypothetical protein
MKVTICNDEKTAVDGEGKIWKINGVMVKREPPKEPTFHPLDENAELFTRLVCSRGLIYHAAEVGEDLINIL